MSRNVLLKFAPGPNGDEAQQKVLAEITEALEELGIHEGWTEGTTFKVNLVLEEISLNVMVYGGKIPRPDAGNGHCDRVERKRGHHRGSRWRQTIQPHPRSAPRARCLPRSGRSRGRTGDSPGEKNGGEPFVPSRWNLEPADHNGTEGLRAVGQETQPSSPDSSPRQSRILTRMRIRAVEGGRDPDPPAGNGQPGPPSGTEEPRRNHQGTPLHASPAHIKPGKPKGGAPVDTGARAFGEK